MKWSLTFLIFLCFSCALTSCGPQRTTGGFPSPGYDFSEVVAGIVKLHEDADKTWHDEGLVIKYIPSGALARRPKEFDPNAHFGVLKHLSMADGYVLDFVYFYDGDGRPFLYARPASSEPYKTFGEYDKALGGKWLALQAQKDALLGEAGKGGFSRSFNDALQEFHELRKREGEPLQGSRAVLDAERDFLDKVRVDGSPESFFELAVLYELAGQFYIEWHFHYNDTQIAVARDDVNEIITALEHDLGPFTQSQKHEARLMDVRPWVKFVNENRVGVSMVTFSEWGGFTQNTYLIRRQFPHTIVDIHRRTLVEYDYPGVI